MFVEAIIFLILAFLLLIYFNRKPSYLPPGDWGWPIIGMIPGGRKYYVKLFKQFKEKYGGGIYCTNIGTRLVVFITDFELLKKSYSMLEFCGRPDTYTIGTFGDYLGVSMAEGKAWHVNRRFALKNLREFGMGKSRMEQYIMEEVKHFIASIETDLGKPRKLGPAVDVAMFNLSWQISANTRFSMDDEDIKRFNELNVENFWILNYSRVRILDFYPWLAKLPHFVLHNFLDAKRFVKNKEDLKDYFLNFINKHKETFDRSNPRDLIDMYFLDQEAAKEEDLAFMHNKRNLVNILINFFNGSEVAGNTFRWFINLMAKHQDIQRKAQKLIDEFIPRDRLPEWEDRLKLGYIQACIYETARVGSVTIHGVPHAMTEDVHFENYLLPKGTMVLGCFEEAHHDPKYWKHPNMFYPEHFLDESGNFDLTDRAFVAFSIGKRMCIGKSLMDMSLFIFAATALQHFTFRPAKGVNITYDSKNISQFINYAVNYDIIVEKRL